MSEADSATFLGINYSGMHNSSICLVDGGRGVVFAASEERLSRVKQDGRFPTRTLADVDLSRIAGVGVPYLAISPGAQQSHSVFSSLLAPATSPPPGYPVLPFPDPWQAKIDSLGHPVAYFDHHEMHAYTGFVLSGYEEALVLTADSGAYSCPVTMGVYHVQRGKVSLLAGASFSDHVALGWLYSDVTALLGFQPCRHEGKVTGLAARGRRIADCRQAVWDVHLEIRKSGTVFYDWVNFLGEDVPPSCETNRYLVDRYRGWLSHFSDAEIARAVQDILEEKLLAVGTWIAEEYGRGLPLILSGGVFANVRANLELARIGFSRIFVCPPMGDEGLAIGAAAAAQEKFTEGRVTGGRVTTPLPMDLGTNVDLDTEAVLHECGIACLRDDDPAGYLARRLAEGATAAIVRGRGEFGPRALGNRSILASAADRAVNDVLNAKLGRTEFMPFAPILRLERFADVFDLDDIPSDVTDCLPFMTICLPVRPEAAALCPAVVHVDGTARPQVVTEASDPFLHRLLGSYEERTGLPVLINTSFNIHDEPLVSSSRDAIRTFFAAELDVLMLGEFLIEVAQNRTASRLAKMSGCREIDIAKKRHQALSWSFGRQIVERSVRFSENSDSQRLEAVRAGDPSEEFAI